MEEQNTSVFWFYRDHLFYRERHGEYINGKMTTLSLEAFPLIEDFEVKLRYRKQFGYQVEYFSQKQGFLADFPYWDNADYDVHKEDFVTPCEYDDVDQGWELLIFEKNNHIYVVTGNFDLHEEGYDKWFRVNKKRYLESWKTAIDIARNLQGK